MNANHAPRPIGKDWTAQLARLQPWYVLTRYQNRLTRSVFAFVNGSLAIAILSLAAVATSQPLIFPSLGPSAFLFFFQPSAVTSSPRNAIVCHGCGVLVGLGCYWTSVLLFGSGTIVGQIVAAAISLGLISSLMIASDIAHAPAASTALIVSLGHMTRWQDGIAIVAAVSMLAAQAWLFNRLSGVYFPLWRGKPRENTQGIEALALRIATPQTPDDTYADLADQLVSRRKVAPSPPQK
jgi:CBS-domain-containing membrane protein